MVARQHYSINNPLIYQVDTSAFKSRYRWSQIYDSLCSLAIYIQVFNHVEFKYFSLERGDDMYASKRSFYGGDFGGMAKLYARMNYVEYAKVTVVHLCGILGFHWRI